MITSPTSVPYRQKEGLNFSSIKTFDHKGPKVFYKEYVLGLREDMDSNAILVGNIVDDIILNYGGDQTLFEQNFDEKYARFDGNKSSAQAFVLADYLFDIIKETIREGVVTGDFEACFKQAFARCQEDGKYKGKTWEAGLADFDKVSKSYYESKINAIGKQVVDLTTLNIAYNLAKQLMTDPFTAPLLNNEGNMLLTKIELSFEYKGLKCKGEMDALEVNHDEQWVRPYDLKCTFDNEDFPYSYIKNKYYLQQAFYTIGLKKWLEENEMEHYEVKGFCFLVGDTSINSRRPLVYRLSEQDFENGVKGFSLRGYEYKGLDKLVEEIKWHLQTDIWDCGMDAFLSNGNLILNINYDKQ